MRERVNTFITTCTLPILQIYSTQRYFLRKRPNSATRKKDGVGTSRRLSAGRCAGSRRRGYARSSFFVRTTHGAHSLSHRVILSRSGPLWRAHQHTHTHLQPRTTFSMGGQAAGQERGRHRRHIFTQRAMYEHVSHEGDCGWEPTAQQAHSVPFANIVASMLPLPCLARHAALHLAAP